MTKMPLLKGGFGLSRALKTPQCRHPLIDSYLIYLCFSITHYAANLD